MIRSRKAAAEDESYPSPSAIVTVLVPIEKKKGDPYMFCSMSGKAIREGLYKQWQDGLGLSSPPHHLSKHNHTEAFFRHYF